MFSLSFSCLTRHHHSFHQVFLLPALTVLLATSSTLVGTPAALGIAPILASPTAEKGMTSPRALRGPLSRSLDFHPPVEGPTVRGFSVGPERWSRGHRGVDLASRPGEVAHAAGPGVVSFVGMVVDRPLVVIDHGPSLLVPPGEHLFTIYEPVTPLVTEGDTVRQDEAIGVVQAGHHGCPGVCLHWGARWGHGHQSRYLNPWLLVKNLPLSLLRWVD